MSRFITKLRLFAACLSRAIIRIRYNNTPSPLVTGCFVYGQSKRQFNAESG